MKHDILLRPVLCFLFILNGGLLPAQEKSVSLKGITDAAIDIQGFLYVSSKKGEINKYDSKGEKILSYSSPLSFSVSSIDVSFGFRILGFYYEAQSLVILDRNLNTLFEYDLDYTPVQNAGKLTYSNDNMLLIYDHIDNSLKKYDPVQSRIIFSTSLPFIRKNQGLTIRQIKEYRNRIYLVDAGGEIYLVDNLGNYIKKLPYKSDNYISFYQDHLLFIREGRPGFLHLSTGEWTVFNELQPGEQVIKILQHDQDIWLVYPDHIDKFIQSMR